MKVKSYVFDSTISSAVPAGDELVAETAVEPARAVAGRTPVSDELLQRMHRYWMAANYLTVGQIFLQDNPLLREPLRAEHIKPRLLGHWGTSPGLSLLYVHLNRLIVERDANVIYLAGPGTAVRPSSPTCISRARTARCIPMSRATRRGLRRSFDNSQRPAESRATSACRRPGSIHEGGELGYVLAHAFGAAFDNPDLIVAAVVGDGEAETGPLEGSWKSISFLNPARDGAVLPILHLNGYKISGPTVLARDDDDDVARCSRATDTTSTSSPATIRCACISASPPSLDELLRRAFAPSSPTRARSARPTSRARRDGRRSFCGRQRDGLDRGRRRPAGRGNVPRASGPVAQRANRPGELRCSKRGFAATNQNRCSTKRAAGHRARHASRPAAIAAWARTRTPTAAGLLRPLDLPDFRDYAVDVPTPGDRQRESTRQLGEMLRDIFVRNAAAANFRLFCPDETNSNRLSAVFEVENRCLVGRPLDRRSRRAPTAESWRC